MFEPNTASIIYIMEPKERKFAVNLYQPQRYSSGIYDKLEHITKTHRWEKSHKTANKMNEPAIPETLRSILNSNHDVNTSIEYLLSLDSSPFSRGLNFIDQIKARYKKYLEDFVKYGPS